MKFGMRKKQEKLAFDQVRHSKLGGGDLLVGTTKIVTRFNTEMITLGGQIFIFCIYCIYTMIINFTKHNLLLYKYQHLSYLR